MIISLDLSSSCVGITMWSEQGIFIDLDHFVFKMDKGIDKERYELIKTDMFMDWIKTILHGLTITTIFIEEALKGSNNSNTVLMLNSFNGMCRYALYKHYQIIPIKISVNQSRKIFFPEYVSTKKVKCVIKETLSIPKELDKKELIRLKVAELQPDIVWNLDKKGKQLQTNYDMSDSYLIGWSGLKILGII